MPKNKSKLSLKILEDVLPLVKKTKHRLLDEDYEFWKDQPIAHFYSMFFTGLVQVPKLMKCVKTGLLDKGHDEKEINNVFYYFLKLDHKIEKGIWSWDEADEFDIDWENIKKTTTSWTL